MDGRDAYRCDLMNESVVNRTTIRSEHQVQQLSNELEWNDLGPLRRRRLLLRVFHFPASFFFPLSLSSSSSFFFYRFLSVRVLFSRVTCVVEWFPVDNTPFSFPSTYILRRRRRRLRGCK